MNQPETMTNPRLEADEIFDGIAMILRDAITIFEEDKTVQREFFKLYEKALDSRNRLRYGRA